MDPNSFLTVTDFNGDGENDIATGNPRALTLLMSHEGEWFKTEADFAAPPNVNGQVVRQLFAILGPNRILFQRGSSFSLIDPAGRGTIAKELIRQSVDSETWLKAFAGFDHLTPLEMPPCAQSLLGIGLAPPEAGAVPREIQILAYDGAETILVSDGGLGAKNVQALSIVELEASNDYLIGIVDGRGGVPNRFVLARLSACDAIIELASTEIEFDWQTPDAPFGYSNPTLPKRGVVLAGIAVVGGAEFIHYDGFSLRTFSVGKVNDGWIIAASRSTVHASRKDYAW